MTRTHRAGTIAVLALLLGAVTAHATITIVNTDSPGEGFNDPTTVSPVGGNPGTTLGQQRLNVFAHAAAIWDGILQSPVEIRVQASFDPLFCTTTSAVLGSAGPWSAERNFPGQGFAGTWYVTAEANRLNGTDLEPGLDDIVAQFNSSLGTPGCLTGRDWYYGFDDNEGATGIDLLPVVLHEIGHGLGFLTLTDESSGSEFDGTPTIFDRFLMDDVTGKHWVDMTDVERVASSIHSGHLVWDGPVVTSDAPLYLGKRPHVLATGSLTADLVALQATFGAPLTDAGFTGDVVDVNDGVSPVTDACETPFVNAAAVAGHIALIDRGTCTLVQKAVNAQAAGASGILFVHNVAGTPGTVSGVAPSVTIPIASISMEDGAAIRAALVNGAVHVNMILDDNFHAGADDADRVKMFAPNPDQPGSSVSHWDVTAYPNLLMEPAINADLTTNVDLTYAAFRDIGWFAGVLAVPPAPSPATLALEIGPNPSRGATRVRFSLPVEGSVDLALFDVAGRRVARLAHGRYPAGDHTIPWSGRDDWGHEVGAGVYLARLDAGGAIRTTHVVRME